MEEAARPKIKRVLRYLVSLKLPIPEIVFKHTFTGVAGGASVWKGTTSYLEISVKGEGRTKIECKASIYQTILDCLQVEEFGGVERNMVLPSPTQTPPPKKRGSKASQAKTQLNDQAHEAEIAGEYEAIFYGNTMIYIREFMSKSDGFLMDFTVSAHNGSLVTNRLFVFLLGGPDVIPLLEKGFIELDVNFAAVHKVFNLLCSDEDASDPFPSVSLKNKDKTRFSFEETGLGAAQNVRPPPPNPLPSS